MQQILANTHYRRSFFLIVSLAIMLAIGVRYVWLPQMDATLTLKGAQLVASLLEKIITSFLVTVLIGCLIFWLEPKVARQTNFVVINPRDISDLLARALHDSKEWWFRGGTGRYLRAVTLPTMGGRSRKLSSIRRVHVQLLDPANRIVCEQYAGYRRGVRSSASQAEWTLERVRAEVCATLLSIFLNAAEYPLLGAQVTLTPTFSSFRVDLSARYAVITKEDPSAPAVRCDQGTYFFDAYKDDMELTAQMGRPVPIPPGPIDLSLAHMRQVFTNLGLDPGDLTDEFLQTVIEWAKAPANPYA